MPAMKVGLRFVAESRLPMTAQAATSTAVQARLARETHLLTGMTDFSTVVGASSLASPAIIAALPESGMFGKPEPFAYYSIRFRRGPSGRRPAGRSSPRAKRAGGADAPDHRGGEMPMPQADASGNATSIAELTMITIGGGTTDIVGKSVIVHKDPDDFKTQPTGNSGARVAC